MQLTPFQHVPDPPAISAIAVVGGVLFASAGARLFRLEMRYGDIGQAAGYVLVPVPFQDELQPAFDPASVFEAVRRASPGSLSP